jgi:hypothetical protein
LAAEFKRADTKYKYFVNDCLDDAEKNPRFTGPRIEASESPVYRRREIL